MKKSGKLVLCAAAALLIVAVGLAFMPLYQYDSEGLEHDCGSFFLRAADRCHSVEYTSAGVFCALILGMAVVTAVVGFIVGKPEKIHPDADARTHTVPAKSARAAWKSVGVERRREVFRLLRRGESHPEPDVSAAAYAWSHSSAWEGWTNRVPGWLLPGVGLALLAGALTTGDADLFQVALSIFVVFSGLMGWNSRACAARLRRVYDAPPDAALPPSHM